MADYHADEQVTVPADRLFAYLSDIANLPTYFDRMTSATPGDGESVQVTADLGDRQVEGEAWFKVDDDKRTLAWGSEGPNDYHGHLTVSGEGDNSAVAITLSTERVETDGVQRGLDETVANIKRLVEDG